MPQGRQGARASIIWIWKPHAIKSTPAYEFGARGSPEHLVREKRGPVHATISIDRKKYNAYGRRSTTETSIFDVTEDQSMLVDITLNSCSNSILFETFLISIELTD